MEEQFFDSNNDAENMFYSSIWSSDPERPLAFPSHDSLSSRISPGPFTFGNPLGHQLDITWQYEDSPDLQENQHYTPETNKSAEKTFDIVEEGLATSQNKLSPIDIFKYESDVQQSSSHEVDQPSSELDTRKAKSKDVAQGPSDFKSTQPRKRARRTRRKKTDDPNSEIEQEKRSKFLERNRLAASKCRQKKKVWAGELEDRARELQSDKDGLSVLANSLKEEILWLKGEMLKHNTCDCTQVRSYMKEQVGNISKAIHQKCPHHHDSYDSKASSNRRKESISSSLSFLSEENYSGDSVVFSEASDDTQQPSPISSPRTMSDHELEILLASHLTHNTSDEGIARQIHEGVSQRRQST